MMKEIQEIELHKSATPKLKICAVEIPMWDGEDNITRKIDGILVEDIDNPKIKDYFYPFTVQKEFRNTINNILWKKNVALNESFKQAYISKRDIVIVDTKGKLKFISWIQYENIFKWCPFYSAPKKDECKVIEM